MAPVNKDDSTTRSLPLDELLTYIERYADSIIVHEFVNGKRVALPLSHCSARTAIRNTCLWIRRGQTPHRLLGAKERNASA